MKGLTGSDRSSREAWGLDSTTAKSARTGPLLITGSAALTQESEGQRHGWDGLRGDMASLVKRPDARRRKDPHPTPTAPPPAQGARAVQQVDDVTAQEVQMGGVRGGVVAEGVSQAGFLHTHMHTHNEDKV